MIQDTSTKAFVEEIVPTLSLRHKAVFDALKRLDQATNSELSVHLGWTINRITPRVLELRERGIVFEADKRHCKVTGRMAYVWSIKKGQLEMKL